MADEVAYASAGGDSNKRKYEDSPSPVARRATGFSSAPDSAAPPPSYNTVPPPMNEIELAKQKAQEIAARLLNNSDPSKRARVENGAGGGGGFDVMDGGAGYGQKPLGLGLSGPPQGASYGYPSPTKRIEIPNGRVGVIIGKGGETIKYLQLQSGAKIQVTRDMDADPNSTTRGVELMGTPDQVAKAEQLINDVLSEADTGGSGLVSRRLTGQQSGAEQFVMKVLNNKVGLVIGKGGETIKNMQATTGARIQVIPLHLPPGDMSRERTVQIEGTSEQIEAAKQLVNEVTSEDSMNQRISGVEMSIASSEAQNLSLGEISFMLMEHLSPITDLLKKIQITLDSQSSLIENQASRIQTLEQKIDQLLPSCSFQRKEEKKNNLSVTSPTEMKTLEVVNPTTKVVNPTTSTSNSLTTSSVNEIKYTLVEPKKKAQQKKAQQKKTLTVDPVKEFIKAQEFPTLGKNKKIGLVAPSQLQTQSYSNIVSTSTPDVSIVSKYINSFFEIFEELRRNPTSENIKENKGYFVTSKNGLPVLTALPGCNTELVKNCFNYGLLTQIYSENGEELKQLPKSPIDFSKIFTKFKNLTKAKMIYLSFQQCTPDMTLKDHINIPITLVKIGTTSEILMKTPMEKKDIPYNQMDIIEASLENRAKTLMSIKNSLSQILQQKINIWLYETRNNFIVYSLTREETKPDYMKEIYKWFYTITIPDAPASERTRALKPEFMSSKGFRLLCQLQSKDEDHTCKYCNEDILPV